MAAAAHTRVALSAMSLDDQVEWTPSSPARAPAPCLPRDSYSSSAFTSRHTSSTMPSFGRGSLASALLLDSEPVSPRSPDGLPPIPAADSASDHTHQTQPSTDFTHHTHHTQSSGGIEPFRFALPDIASPSDTPSAASEPAANGALSHDADESGNGTESETATATGTETDAATAAAAAAAAPETPTAPRAGSHRPMAWGAYFWAVVTDPASGEDFFANPHTGECRWQVPAGTLVLPPPKEGAWLEFFDTSLGRPYFHNTISQTTQWDRPDGLVIPMTAVQESSVYIPSATPTRSKRLSLLSPQGEKVAPPSPAQKFGAADAPRPIRPRRGSVPDSHRRHTHRIKPPDPEPLPASSNELASKITNAMLHAPLKPPLTSCPSPSPSFSGSSSHTFTTSTPNSAVTTAPVLTSISSAPPTPLKRHAPRAAGGAVQWATYAAEKFSSQREGILRLRRKIPLGRLQAWQRDPIASPLLESTTRNNVREAVTTFKIILRICGDRAAPVLSPSSSVLDELRWVVDTGLNHAGLRDELFVQLMKQLTNNPSADSRFRGWQMLCAVLITGFPPSEELQGPCESWIDEKRDLHRPSPELSGEGDAILTVMTACTTWLQSATYRGARLTSPTIDGIVAALESPFNPCIFNLSLETAMRIQAAAYPRPQVPVVLSFCADAMLALDASRTKGMWLRAPESAIVRALAHRIDRGTYALAGLPPDPTLPACVLMMYLAELVPALLPASIIPNAVPASHGSLVRLLRPLKPLPRRVLLFVLSFLQVFCTPESVAATGVPPARIAACFAPVLFGDKDAWETISKARSSQSIRSREASFLTSCLLHLDCARVDPEYIPSHGRGPHSTDTEAEGEMEEMLPHPSVPNTARPAYGTASVAHTSVGFTPALLVESATSEDDTMGETVNRDVEFSDPGFDYELQSAAQSARTSRLILNGINGLPTLASALAASDVTAQADTSGA